MDLLEVDLADIVITYIDHLERRGELDLEATTEFLVLIAVAAGAQERGCCCPARRSRSSSSTRARRPRSCWQRLRRGPALPGRGRASATSASRSQEGHRFRSAPLPPSLRRAPSHDAAAVYDPERLTAAIGDLLLVPPPVDVRHITVATGDRRRASDAPAPAARQRALSRSPTRSRTPTG